MTKTGPAAFGLGRLGDAVGDRVRLAQNASFQAFSRLAGDVGLRPGHDAVLHLIQENSGMSQTSIGRAPGRDESTRARILAGAERGGPVQREVDPGDRRGRRLTLTRAGKAKLQMLMECANRHEARIDALLGPERRAQLMDSPDIVITGREAEAGRPPAGRDEER